MINPKALKEYDIRGIYPTDIKDDDVYKLGYAFIKTRKIKNIVVCRDKRKESTKICNAFVSGAHDAGAKISDLGVNGSPVMFFAVGLKGYDAGVMFTPSHNPDGYVGIKFCTKDGSAIGSKTGLKELVKAANKVSITPRVRKITTTNVEVFKDYEKYGRALVDFSGIKNFKLVMDASDGSGYAIANYFFSKLKIKTVKMNFRAGDKYPKHGLNPMLEENCRDLSNEVKKQNADMGVIWDGDADRIIFTDENGAIIHPYFINCLMYRIIMLKFGYLKDRLPLVLDARMPLGMSEIISSMGGKAVISRSGYVNILKKMKDIRSIYSSENSGHYFFNFSVVSKKNFVFEDAILPAILIAEYLSLNKSKLSEVLAEFQKDNFISGEINLKIDDFKKVKNRIVVNYKNYKKSELDGLSILSDKWCFNIRPSKTEPLVRLNIEGKSRKLVNEQKKKLLKIIK